MAGLGTGAGAPVVKVYHEKSMILPDVSRVLACLYEKNVEFETVKDSYKDILRLQSTRSVPVPFYDGPIFRQESRAICRYIAETYEQRGYPFLLGKDVLERASIEQWLRHEEHAFDPPSRALFCHLAFPMHDEDMSDIDREKRKLEEVLEVYEQRLGESEFLAGNKFTLADLVHLPNTHHIVTSEKFAYLYDSRKNVQRWWNTISARDSWQQVVKDMQSVEEQNQIEELEQQQLEEEWQWETEPPPTSGRRILHINPRQQTGTESRTVLVPPPNGGAISSSSFTVQQEQQPLHTETTSHGETSPNHRKGSNFFTTTDKTPAPSKPKTSTPQKPPSSVEGTRSNFFTPASPPTTTKVSPKTNNEKSTSKDASPATRPSQGLSKESPDEAATHTKPTSQEASKTSDRDFQARQTGEVVAPHKLHLGSDKAPQENTPEKSTQKSPSSVQNTRSSFFTPATTKMPQRTNTDKSTYKDASSPTIPSQGSSKDSIKEAREADQKRSASATTRELPSGSQNIPQQSKASPNLKASDLSPMQEEFEDTQGEDEWFSTKRLRKMIEQSDPEVLKAQSTDLQTHPTQEETPSISKKPSYVQDRKGQAGNNPTDGKTDGIPSTGTRDPGTPSTGTSDPGTPTTADARRATSPPKGAAQDDDLAQSNIDQWRHTSTPANQEGAPGAAITDKLDKAADKREQTHAPNKTSTGQSDKIAMPTPRRTTTTSDQAPVSPFFADRRKTGIDEASQTTKVAPDEQPAGRAPTNSVNKPISSKDNGKLTNETVYYSSSEISREMAPPGSERSMGQQKMQSDKSSISLQANGKQGSEAAVLTNTDQNTGKTSGQDLQESQKQISPDTQQMKNNRSNSTLDGSSKPTQFDGNEGDVRETQRGG
ncbi:hypothetical protein ACQ4PT_047524 [Festuca glaucescens]